MGIEHTHRHVSTTGNNTVTDKLHDAVLPQQPPSRLAFVGREDVWQSRQASVNKCPPLPNQGWSPGLVTHSCILLGGCGRQCQEMVHHKQVLSLL